MSDWLAQHGIGGGASAGRPAPGGMESIAISAPRINPTGGLTNSSAWSMFNNALNAGALGAPGQLLGLGMMGYKGYQDLGGISGAVSKAKNIYNGGDPGMDSGQAAPDDGTITRTDANPDPQPTPSSPTPTGPTIPWGLGGMPSGGAMGGGIGAGIGLLGGGSAGGPVSDPGVSGGVQIPGQGGPIPVPGNPNVPGGVAQPTDLWNPAPVNGYMMNQTARTGLLAQAMNPYQQKLQQIANAIKAPTKKGK